MHLLSKYVIKPIAFDPNPYVLPRAAQFVKYGGANKYFQKHGKQNGGQQQTDGDVAQIIRRPQTQQQPADPIDDFEKVASKPKKPARVPYKKL